MSSEEEVSIKVSLKPRCNIKATIQELHSATTAVDLNIYKRFEDVDGEVEDFFVALGSLPKLKRLTISSKGTNIQVVPVPLLASCMAKAQGLEILHFQHIRVRGLETEFDDFSDILAEHEHLRVLKLECEDLDVLEKPVAAAGNIPTLEICEIESATIATKLAEPSESLCWSKSLKSLKLINVATCFGDMSDVVSLLAVNQVLEELTMQVAELDPKGGGELVKMIAYNTSLKKVILKADRMAGKELGEAFIDSLQKNETLEYFQIVLDGRQSDMKVVRAMGVKFRDTLKGTFKCKPQAGMTMGVICERELAETD